MTLTTDNGTVLEIMADGPAPAVLLNGKKVGAAIGCWGDAKPTLNITDQSAREQLGQFVALTDAQQKDVVAVYTQSMPSWADPNNNIWDDAEFADDQNPYAFLGANPVDDSNSDNIEETNRSGAN